MKSWFTTSMNGTSVGKQTLPLLAGEWIVTAIPEFNLITLLKCWCALWPSRNTVGYIPLPPCRSIWKHGDLAVSINVNDWMFNLAVSFYFRVNENIMYRDSYNGSCFNTQKQSVNYLLLYSATLIYPKHGVEGKL